MRKARVDKNQKEIVEAFRSLGYSVAHTHTIGRGFPDIAIGKNGATHLIEIKTEKGKLTDLEKSFQDAWKGSLKVIRNLEDVLAFDKNQTKKTTA